MKFTITHLFSFCITVIGIFATIMSFCNEVLELELDGVVGMGVVMTSVIGALLLQVALIKVHHLNIKLPTDADYIQYEREYLDKEKIKMNLSQEDAIKQLRNDLMHQENNEYFEELFENENENENQKKT